MCSQTVGLPLCCLLRVVMFYAHGPPRRRVLTGILVGDELGWAVCQKAMHCTNDDIKMIASSNFGSGECYCKVLYGL